MKTILALWIATLLIVACDSINENTVNFRDLPQAVTALKVNSLLFGRVNNKVEAIQFDSLYIYFTGKRLPMNDTVRSFPFEKFTENEFQNFKKNLRYLSKNNIVAIRGSLRTGFVTFALKANDNDEFRDLKYITLDNGKLNLDHTGFKILDKKGSIVLLIQNR